MEMSFRWFCPGMKFVQFVPSSCQSDLFVIVDCEGDYITTANIILKQACCKLWTQYRENIFPFLLKYEGIRNSYIKGIKYKR